LHRPLLFSLSLIVLKKAATTNTFHMTFLVLRFAWPLNCEEDKRRPIATAAGGGWVDFVV